LPARQSYGLIPFPDREWMDKKRGDALTGCLEWSKTHSEQTGGHENNNRYGNAKDEKNGPV